MRKTKNDIKNISQCPVRSKSKILNIFRNLEDYPNLKFSRKELLEASIQLQKEIEFQQWGIDRIQFQQKILENCILKRIK